MTISLKKLKARLLANPKVEAEYDALASEFEISVKSVKKPRSSPSRRPPASDKS
jgi:hypothetical protein